MRSREQRQGRAQAQIQAQSPSPNRRSAKPSAAPMPATAVPTAPSCIGRRGKRRRDSDDCDGGCSASALSSGRTSGSRKARYRTAARATSSKSGFRAFTAMSAVATRSPRAASPRSHCAGCSRRPSPLVFSLSQGAWISCSAGAGPTPSPTRMPRCTILTGLWWLADVLLKRHYNWARQKWERRPNLGRRRTIPPSSLIHELAYRRGGDYARRLPPDAIPTS